MNSGVVLSDGRVIDHHGDVARSADQVLRMDERDALHPSDQAEVLLLVSNLRRHGLLGRCVDLCSAPGIMCNEHLSLYWI